ncbi:MULTISPECIES: glycine zipper 2TM domain-containing protein [unclassified Methylophilus]|uniref:glycine zipper 2TM domain-containing protein n=1 Tax=unclassified Methylophilus TaxID=2630143 RepID=UPI00188E7688|nr:MULTISPECIES: glycine zipper 2TM domain-containing protein [unclassified Methylophilus]MBF5040353.1 glycine zipper 2TM domain-containing protein [Methylophilus sp. 13]MDF0378310.1 glycine zipper 2TM domain-containing protein [Methylophilus sp. YYY-1]MDT7849770.1 glycine zipper 2TM domain-containing protein [Methylophilus sp. VKM B-3414]BEV07308.1 glycine zipper 2TM domain-containing protein [Methylophilus sp. DW102]
MKTRVLQWLAVVLVTGILAACASSNSGSVYSRDEARRAQTVKTGVVESVRAVKLEGTKSPVGTIAGGAIGGIAGSSVGGGRGSAIAAVIGAVAGGLAGSAAEEAVTRKNALEITVKLDGGGLVAIVQEADEQFNAGDRVRIVENGGTSRVSH